MICEKCKEFIYDKTFVDYYDFRGGRYIRNIILPPRYNYLKIKFTHKFDMILCNNCFIFKNVSFSNQNIITIPEYIPVEQCTRWLKGYLLV